MEIIGSYAFFWLFYGLQLHILSNYLNKKRKAEKGENMLGKVFGIICLISFVGAILTGNLTALGEAVLDGASDAVTLTLSLCGMMGLWCGIMRILERAGIIGKLARLMHPLLRFFFPDAAKDPDGCGEIAANISANLLGLGNAATPFALRAMEKLQKQNPTPDTASPDMITLAVLNTASINLIPTTVITLLRSAGSSNPYRVIFPIWICSTGSALFALCLCRAMRMGYTGVRRARSASASLRESVTKKKSGETS